MNTRFVPPGAERKDPARVLILGEPGVGKTRLAATFPDPLFVDIETDGSASALPEPPARVIVPMTPNTLRDTISVLKAIKANKTGPGLYTYEGTPVRTVVIDPIDQIQRSVQTKILAGKDVMQMRNWGQLLEQMYPLVLEWSGLDCYLVVVGHVKRQADDDNRNKPVEATLAVRGALKSELPGWFSIILHVIAGVEGKRSVVSQPMISKGVRYVAKDRHNVLASLGSPLIDITSKSGWPGPEVANTICGGNDGGTAKDA